MSTWRIQRSASAVQFVLDKQVQEEKDLKECGEVQQVSTFRRALPQVLASTAKNLILLDLGMTIAFPTIVIPVLINATSGLSLTTTQASWFGSIGFICQPIGSILSGIVLEPLGRKYSMLLINIPHIIGWYLFYTATTHFRLFAGIIIMGLGVGFMEAPIITYVGEISEPRFRGMLISFAGNFISLGIVLIYSIGNLMDWQSVAGISIAVPVITILAISQVPETPLWLLSRGRYEDAEKALCWLRGWVEPRAVRQELTDMIKFSEYSQLRKKSKGAQPAKAVYVNKVNLDDEGKAGDTLEMNGKVSDVGDENKMKLKDNKSEFVSVELVDQTKSIQTINTNSTKSETFDINNDTGFETDWKVRLKDFVRPEMLKPLGLVIGSFFFQNASGIAAMRPYLIRVFEKLHFPINPLHATVIFSCIQFFGNILCLLTVRYTGKKPMAVVSLFLCGVATTVTGLYALFAKDATQSGLIPLILFVGLTFFTGYGVSPIPWMLVSEVFPFRGRSLASGVAAAAAYLLGFLATKTYLGLEASLSVGGVFLLYGVLTFVGVVFLMRFMVETEGRSLEEIEEVFKSKK